LGPPDDIRLIDRHVRGHWRDVAALIGASSKVVVAAGIGAGRGKLVNFGGFPSYGLPCPATSVRCRRCGSWPCFSPAA